MKLRNIFIAGMSLAALASCSDYLDVDAPSKNDYGYVFSQKIEMERALNGVYTGLISGNTFGDMIFTSFQLNSDVDFASNGSATPSSGNFKRFDCDADGGNLNKIWATLYEGIEAANLFIEGVENSPLYDAEDPDTAIAQMLGEAKVIRAIYYHELIWMFGDVPFSFNSTKTSEVLIYPIVDRMEIIDKLIADIKGIADHMQLSGEVSVERPNRQAAYGMIARLAMTAAGYTLRPDGDSYGKMERMSKENYRQYYQIARDAANEVINGTMAGTHALNKTYQQVFIDECNFIVDNKDDVIFEIPFAKNNSGNIGYINGVTMKSYDGETATHNYGKADAGKAALNAFYRFMFDPEDSRRDYINQLFYLDGTATTNPAKCSAGYTVNNGKWSKLWNNGGLGSRSEGSTGINYPYLRYTDVLLMFAEADNELNGAPTAEAMAALEQVRNRAFRSTNPAKVTDYPKGSKEEFLKAVLDERKFEFAGENMRWRDLVRNNMLGQQLYWTFFRYYAAADRGSGYDSPVAEFDFGDGSAYDKKWMNSLYYLNNVPNNDYYSFNQFPQASPNVRVVYIVNPYRLPQSGDEKIKIKVDGKDQTVARADYMNWFDENTSKPTAHFLYSLRGYIYCNESGNILINDNGSYVGAPNPSTFPSVSELPAVRYILPYPRAVITRSQGKYVNKYGYR